MEQSCLAKFLEAKSSNRYTKERFSFIIKEVKWLKYLHKIVNTNNRYGTHGKTFNSCTSNIRGSFM